jgi:hypothetical protein
MNVSDNSLIRNRPLDILLRTSPHNNRLRFNNYKLQTWKLLKNLMPIKIGLESSRMNSTTDVPMLKYHVLYQPQLVPSQDNNLMSNPYLSKTQRSLMAAATDSAPLSPIYA